MRKKMQVKKRDINRIYAESEAFLLANKGSKAAELIGKQPRYTNIAHFTPSGANWSYCIGLIKLDGDVYIGVFVFGVCKAIAPLIVPEAEV